jgi:flagellin
MGDISLSKAVRNNLLSLQNTASMMEKTQQRLATGNKVNSALDNPSNFFTASSLNSRAADMSNLLDSMASGIKVIEAANNGLTALTKNLESMQSTLRQARQDKSFQTKSFDIGENGIVSFAGGQFGNELQTVKLSDAVQTPGTKAQVGTTGTVAYLGATATAAAGTEPARGIGARTVVTNSAGTLATSEKFTVAGVEVTVGSTVTNEGTGGVAETVQAALDANSATKDKYVVTADGTTGFTIETVDPKGAAAEVVFNTADAARLASTTFNFDAVPSTMTVGGQSIQTAPDFDTFVANLIEGGEAGNYTVNADKETGNITITNTQQGVAAPVTSIPTPVAPVKQVNTLTVSVAPDNAGTFTIEGIAIDIDIGTEADAAGQIHTHLTTSNDANAVAFREKWDIAINGAAVTFTAKTAVTGNTNFTITPSAGALDAASVVTTAGATEVKGRTDTAGFLGAYSNTVAANTDDFTVTYDGKIANISIHGVTGGLPDGTDPTALDIRNWKDATIASVNSQLSAAGIKGVEASFDADGKFSLVAKEAEAKTLAISGKDAVALFGTETVKTGVPEVTGLVATKTVDKFVELINRDHGSKVRASNDNGKLRIENLSTQALDLGIDANGTNIVNPLKIEGNSVRDNLHKQFNELRDQMDKLSDDASFNGINLLRGDRLTITFNESGSSSINIQSKDKSDNARAINASNLGIDSLVAIDLDSDAGIDSFLSKISSALSDLRSQASAFGSNLSSVQNRQDFTKSMITTLQTGAANLTLADMNEEAANLLALQTRQSLSSSALSMASQADQSVLQLLR